MNIYAQEVHEGGAYKMTDVWDTGDRWTFLNVAKWVGIGLGIGAFIALICWVAVNTHHCPETCTYAVGQKRFVPAHNQHLWDEYCTGRDKDGACKGYIHTPCSHHVPDRWYVSFIDCRGTTHEETVDQAMYNAPPNKVTHVHARWKECPCKEQW